MELDKSTSPKSKKFARSQDAFGALDKLAKTDAARALCTEIHNQIVSSENRKRKRREKDAKSFAEAVSRLTGELLVAKHPVHLWKREGKPGQTS